MRNGAAVFDPDTAKVCSPNKVSPVIRVLRPGTHETEINECPDAFLIVVTPCPAPSNVIPLPPIVIPSFQVNEPAGTVTTEPGEAALILCCISVGEPSLPAMARQAESEIRINRTNLFKIASVLFSNDKRQVGAAALPN